MGGLCRTWGMRYVVGEEGITTGLIAREEAIILFIVAQAQAVPSRTP